MYLEGGGGPGENSSGSDCLRPDLTGGTLSFSAIEGQDILEECLEDDDQSGLDNERTTPLGSVVKKDAALEEWTVLHLIWGLGDGW